MQVNTKNWKGFQTRIRYCEVFVISYVSFWHLSMSYRSIVLLSIFFLYYLMHININSDNTTTNNSSNNNIARENVFSFFEFLFLINLNIFISNFVAFFYRLLCQEQRSMCRTSQRVRGYRHSGEGYRCCPFNANTKEEK